MTEEPYDYAAERDDARRADWWKYPTPGQWVGGEWRSWDPAEWGVDQ